MQKTRMIADGYSKHPVSVHGLRSLPSWKNKWMSCQEEAIRIKLAERLTTQNRGWLDVFFAVAFTATVPASLFLMDQSGALLHSTGFMYGFYAAYHGFYGHYGRFFGGDEA